MHHNFEERYYLKNLFECHLLTAAPGHNLVSVVLQCLLDEPQQVFLIHAGSCVNVSVYFADVVKVSMGYCFLGGQLAQLVQKNVKLVLGGEIAQPLVAKRFPGKFLGC